MPEKQLVSVLAIFYHGGLPASHSLATDQWPLAARHSPLPACFGFGFHPQARAETIQPQAAMSFALIPDWLRLAPFLVPGASLASGVSGDSNSDPLPPVLIPTPIMPSCYRLLTPPSGSFLIFTSVSRWVCSGSTFVNLDRINPLLRFSRRR
jgi:hypothetical protein